jgi:mRNA-degrading endonuclease RelE of RelBE toxin-antitoxin system
MASDVLVITTSRFDRELKKLASQHQRLAELFRRVFIILRADPYNRSCQHPIKKLKAVPAGEGQYRIRSGRFRFRYDIEG